MSHDDCSPHGMVRPTAVGAREISIIAYDHGVAPTACVMHEDEYLVYRDQQERAGNVLELALATRYLRELWNGQSPDSFIQTGKR